VTEASLKRPLSHLPDYWSDGLGTFPGDDPEISAERLPGLHRAISLHPSRCNGYVNAAGYQWPEVESAV